MRRLEDFGKLSPAEERLRDEIGRDVNPNGVVVFGDDLPEADAGPERQVRGSFLRYLMLGGCDALPAPVPEWGVKIKGARITGVLNLEGARCPRVLALFDCRVDANAVLRSTQLDGLYFNGSRVPSLFADRLDVRGGVFLRGFRSQGAVRLLGARIGGSLDCEGAVLSSGADGVSLHGDVLAVGSGVYLGGGFRSQGTVRLLGARLGASLNCAGAEMAAGPNGVTLFADGIEAGSDVRLSVGFKSAGTVRLLGARVGGDLDCEGAMLGSGADGFSLKAEGADVAGCFFIRGGAKITGVLGLTAARFGDINDEKGSWPGPGHLILNRCRYGAFTGSSPVDAPSRIDWLSRQDPTRWGVDFWPQPSEQCAKVLREMGHAEAARDVLIDKERRQRAARRVRARRWSQPLLWLSDALMGATTRYGRRPTVAFLWLLGFWLLGAAVFEAAGRAEAIKPNNAFVLRSPEWAACAPDYFAERGMLAARWRSGHGSQLDCYRDQPEAQSFPDFNALVYSADTLLPIVALEMQEFWIPDGGAARVYLWVHILVGWALSLLAVAGFSGLIKTD
ncbi:MAG: hypothetical protein QNJ16_19320 [Rhodobacter sp.]|nr:hypothetical protein [Rhodobacter sp.]